MAGDDATRSPNGLVREIHAFLAAGVDGVFTDDPALEPAAPWTAHRS